MDLKANRIYAIQYLQKHVNTELQRNTRTDSLRLDFLVIPFRFLTHEQID